MHEQCMHTVQCISKGSQQKLSSFVLPSLLLH